jgi:hypothetical protein
MSLLSRVAVQAARAYGILSSNPNNVAASYLVVAGGGGGGTGTSGGQGGGGGGGFQTSTFTLSTLYTYAITVGAGGSQGVQGSNSVLSGTGITTVTSIGGGLGGSGSFQTGGNGGSGGGGSEGNNPSDGANGGTGTSGQGSNGGKGAGAAGGGGGGASAAGGNAAGSGGTGVDPGDGGAGTASSISGSSVTYAGGGGGSGYGPWTTTTTGTGGAGGGGAGASGQNGSIAVAGTANTGGGGGAKNTAGTGNASGGSGVVIISYTSDTPRFVGGTLTTSGGNQIHTFTSSGTLSPLTPVTAEYLVVAGGGGGATNIGGGGGAGGLQTGSTTLYSVTTYVVTVGAGGSGGSGAGDFVGSNGSNSILSGTGLTTLTSTGGGGGGRNATPTNAGNGGSGGGAGEGSSFGTGTSGQGNNGGTAFDASGAYGGGGGGGAGAVGANGSSSSGGNGGVGVASSITGTSIYYAGGGGGGGIGTVGSGGNGGGGNANATSGGAGTSGTTNLGGGGGAGGGSYGAGGAGGSGTVIISYAGSQVFNGGLVTSSGGNTIHTFTATGALTPLTNNLNNSLRFRSSVSAYLSRTFATTGTNNKIQTFSAWVKRGLLSSSANYRLIGCYNGSASYSTEINFSNDALRIEFGGSAAYELKTTQVFRDPSAWYHIVIAIDTTQATAANRIKMYVNGNQISAFATANYPAQNDSSQLASANANNKIGANWNTSGAAEYFDGYMTDINFIDGQALEPYYFGNNDANGVWKPIKYTGMYGTNGFYLTFGNTTSTTTLGYDSSPNGNNWTTNNISLTAGVTYDAMLDVPTNTSATVANYCTLNRLFVSTSTISNANLQVATTVGTGGLVIGTIGGLTTGKYYWEATIVSQTNNPSNTSTVGIIYKTSGRSSDYLDTPDGDKFVNPSSAATNDILGVAVDFDSGSMSVYKNNTLSSTVSFTSSLGWYPAFSDAHGDQTTTLAINFGQRPFTYTPPTGFVALNTFNLPTPTILQGNRYMDATLYTGTRATQVVANSGQFKPDMVWCKGRSFTSQILVSDSVRGTTKQLFTQLTIAEQTDSTFITSFNNNGFTMGDGSGGPYGNINYEIGGTHVAWQWQAGQGTTSSNTSGSITSTVSANTTAGLSIATYTGTGSNATVGHGLGVAPSMVIVKSRGTAENWMVYHTSVGATKYIYLDSNGAPVTLSTIWNNTAPTSSVFSIGTNATVNQASTNYVAYCWAEIAGFSRFGSYTGNGSADGPFIYTGFRPKFIITKVSSTSGYNWNMYDSSRGTYNAADQVLVANGSGAEETGFDPIDFLSNGFKLRMGNRGSNVTNATYIYMAFAEHPFKNANAR